MTLVTMILSAVLVNNIALTSFGGMDVVAVSSRRKINVNTLGMATMIVMSASGLINAIITAVLNNTSFGYLADLIYVAVIVLVSLAVEKYTPYKLGKFACLVVLNGAALSLAIANSTNGYSILQSTLVSIGSGVGLYMAMQVYRSLRSRINDEDVPAAFRGLPIDLLVIAMMAMAVTCFK